MIRLLQKRKRVIAFHLILLMVVQLITPSISFALTSGPSQPETQGFQQAGTSDMVDLFSGDFSYNIPLFELPGPNGGYPFNLSYQSGVGMDQEASWTGLGWSLNPGSINRQMRGLPDEFKGDEITTKMSLNPSVTIGLGAGVGIELFGGDLKLGLGLGITYNNYKGAGYSIDGSVGFERSTSGGVSGGIGLNFSLDSKEGVSLNPSLSLGNEAGEVGLGAGYNSKEGLTNVSANIDVKKVTETKIKDENGNEVTKVNSFGFSSSASLSLARPSYTPQITMPMQNINIATTFKIGGSWWGITGSGYARGFYNEQRLYHDKKKVKTNAYGYLHFQDITKSTDVTDINREKDGMVLKESPNLAMPSLSYDIYSVTGQGISAMYRPFRNDYGRFNDPEVSSLSIGGAIGVDVAPAASHFGVNLSVNHSKSTSGPWTRNNQLVDRLAFQKKNLDSYYEPWYFKVHGEPTAESFDEIKKIGGDNAVRVRLDGDNINPVATTTLENSKTNFQAPANSEVNRARKTRSQSIQPLTNEEILNNGQEVLSQFKIKFIDYDGAEKKFDRASLPGHHIAAFTALTPEGLRYNYGIPAYNLHQEEVTFSVAKKSGQISRVDAGNGGNGDPNYTASGTDKFLKRVEMPPFAHSFLLTSIIGPDYVDVTGDGVTSDDLGYWVKFTYRKTTSPQDRYKWRDPFSQAHFQEGWETDPRDDKGSFTYGEKEMWYLSQAETKSHIAVFTTAVREDAKGVAAKLQDADNKGKSSLLLKEIILYSRFAGITNPIKMVKFEHDYSLCKGSDNSTAPGGNGKLTLKKVWFEYGGSKRGSLNPYVFKYHNTNPDYDIHAYDRWGNYKPYPAGKFDHNKDFPYVEQDPSKKQQYDDNAAAWSLKEIELPSGGRVVVDYETDDYGYVQHLPAMQMTEFINPTGDPNASEFNLSDQDPLVRFKLETPITTVLTPAQEKATVQKYLDLRRNMLYFKMKINLRSASENFHEFISGYVEINDKGRMGLEKDASGKYVYGFFEVKKEEHKNPFSMRTWQHIRTNQPDLANSGKKLEQTDNTGERVKQIKSLGSIGTQIRAMFEGFYNFCANKGWGREVVAGKAWVRLNSPDKIKYGGGLRVRQITMFDEWSHDEEGIYGQVYEYTTEENGAVISSGVAAYEPFIGGEENALRYSKKYVQSVPLRADNNLFFEYPINESYFPGAQVGYSKVTVTSLASASLAGKEVKNITLSDSKKLFPKGEGISYGTTGMTVHEYYTAKDFPVITDETEKKNKPYKLSIPIPFLGGITLSKLTTSQGYSIVTNDMHGKQKKVSNYRQDKTGMIEPTPISWVRYNYASAPRIYDKMNVNTLKNTFRENEDGSLSLAKPDDINDTRVKKFTIGQENEFFTDMRQFEDNAWCGGVAVNTDILYILWFTVPAFVPWPNISKSGTQLKTSVTNKIIFKTGVLESVEAFDGSSTVKTSNIKFDKLTGATVLTSVNNNFDAPVFNYTVPAYTEYQGMGAAYQNIGLTFSISEIAKVPYKNNLYEFNPSIASEDLVPGDEILLYESAGDISKPITRVVYLGDDEGVDVLFSSAALSAADYKCMIVRSGYRNQLSVSAGSISALKDPSVEGVIKKRYEKTISVPSDK